MTPYGTFLSNNHTSLPSLTNPPEYPAHIIVHNNFQFLTTALNSFPLLSVCTRHPCSAVASYLSFLLGCIHIFCPFCPGPCISSLIPYIAHSSIVSYIFHQHLFERNNLYTPAQLRKQATTSERTRISELSEHIMVKTQYNAREMGGN